MSALPSNSTRISKRFAELRASGELGIVAYIVAGDPSLDASLKYVLALAEAGADVIELGVPFSDPLADGPTIQRGAERALKAGTTLAGVLDLIRRIRESSQVPLILFSYYNPILQMGLEKFASTAASAGADGVLATDLTPEESEDYRRILAAHRLETIFLGAPTSTDERLAVSTEEAQEAARITRAHPEVQYTYTTLGGGASGTVDVGNIYVRMVPKSQRRESAEQFATRLRAEMKRVAGVTLAVFTSDFGGGQKQLQFQLKGNDLASLKAGEPLSVTRTVMLFVPGPWSSAGVQVNRPFVGLMEAPVGAGASRLKLNT